MAKDPDQVIARLPPGMIERLDALAAKLATDPEVAAAAGPRGVTRSSAMRRAILAGLDVLEERLGIRRKRKP